MGAFDSFSQEAKSRRAAEVKATQLRNKKRFQTKPTTKPIYGASRHYLDRDWDGESLGQVYIGNKGWVGITPSGRVGYKTANGSYTPIKNLTDYDKQQIALAVNKTGVKALTGDRSREVANAWSKNSGTWLATKQRIAKPNVAKPQVTKNPETPTTPRTPSITSRPRTATKTPASNSWINKSRGIWNYNGVSQADVANAYKTGDFSKVGSYLSQHKDLASYLNNVYSKRGGNQFNQPTQTPTVNTMTLQTLDNVVPKSPVKEITPTAELLPTPTYNRSQTRDYMRSIGMNPYDYSGEERKALRTYLNNPGSMDSKYQPFINQVQNQRTQKMVDSIGTNSLSKPETDTNKLNNQLVNLKFKKGGQMYKYAAGAQMVQPQQTNSQDPIDQIAQIAAGSLYGDENSKQQLIQVLSNKEIAPKLLQIVDAGVKNQDKRAMIIAQAIKALQQGSTRKARLGAKLDYIKQSIGECPEGQEVVYFKRGGEICKVCAGKKMQNGGKSDPIKDFKKKKR